MSLKVGIVGLPNVGKSTLFNALLRRAKAQAENRPFTTIEPNVGVVDVPDERLLRLHQIVRSLMENSKIKKVSQQKVLKKTEKTPSLVPATVEFVDIAGLVRGAHRGEGLGNKFLSHIREVDAIVHVIRFFENEDIVHVDNNLNPANDYETVLLELMLADLALVNKLINNLQKSFKKEPLKAAKKQLQKLQTLQKVAAGLEKEIPINKIILNEEEKDLIRQEQLLTQKPFITLANVSEAQLNEGDELAAQFIKDKDCLILSAQVEAELSDLSEQEAREYLQELGQGEPGLNKLITEAYRSLGLITFFTAGEKEVKAWTVKKGSTARQAAGKIHTDFEKGFIKAEIISYQDYLTYNGEKGAKDAGKVRLEGKDYLIQDGDVVYFHFNR